MSEPQFPGPKVKIGTQEYVVPAVSLGQLRGGLMAKIENHDKLMQDGKFFEATQIRGEIITEVVSRNYPDLDKDVFMNDLDLRNIRDAWAAVMGASEIEGGESGGPLSTASGQSTTS